MLAFIVSRAFIRCLPHIPVGGSVARKAVASEIPQNIFSDKLFMWDILIFAPPPPPHKTVGKSRAVLALGSFSLLERSAHATFYRGIS